MTNINKYSPHCEGKQSSFVSSENGCKHEGKNSSHDEVRQFKVDGEVFFLKKSQNPLRLAPLKRYKEARLLYRVKGF